MLNPYPSQKNYKMKRGDNLFDKRMRMLDVLLINDFLGSLCEKLCIRFAVIFFTTKSTKVKIKISRR
jgi:hypothetical protein